MTGKAERFIYRHADSVDLENCLKKAEGKAF
jgi:hypothetical protein